VAVDEDVRPITWMNPFMVQGKRIKRIIERSDSGNSRTLYERQLKNPRSACPVDVARRLLSSCRRGRVTPPCRGGWRAFLLAPSLRNRGKPTVWSGESDRVAGYIDIFARL
jgi:hypothetical protein